MVARRPIWSMRGLVFVASVLEGSEKALCTEFKTCNFTLKA